MERPIKYNYRYNRGGSGEFTSWFEYSHDQDTYIDHLESKLKEQQDILDKIWDITNPKISNPPRRLLVTIRDILSELFIKEVNEDGNNESTDK